MRPLRYGVWSSFVWGLRGRVSNGPSDGGRKAHRRVTVSHVNEGRTRHVKAGTILIDLRQIKKQKHKAEVIEKEELRWHR